MIELPEPDGTLTKYEPRQEPRVFAPVNTPFRERSVVTAAHVVADRCAANEPFGPPLGPPEPAKLDWDATMAFRRHLWSHGFTVGEALDTAHRGSGLDWATTAELIRRSGAEARAVGGQLAAAVWTDQLTPGPHELKEVTAAYEEQLELVESAGATPIIQASAELATAAESADDYVEVYERLLSQSSRPVVLHWLTSNWIPGHVGYWGHDDVDAATNAFLDLVAKHADKVDGVKIAPLSPAAEIEIRRRLPDGVRFYTADIEQYRQLMEGDEHGHSDGLTPVFAPIAPIAAEGFRALDSGDVAGFRESMDSAWDLVQHVFEGPGRSTLFFKTGLAFLGWLSGHSDQFRMVWAEQGARSLPHLAKACQLADQLGLFPDPALAQQRMKAYLTVGGVPQQA